MGDKKESTVSLIYPRLKICLRRLQAATYVSVCQKSTGKRVFIYIVLMMLIEQAQMPSKKRDIQFFLGVVLSRFFKYKNERSVLQCFFFAQAFIFV